MEACKQYFNTKYVRLPDLLIDLETEWTDGNYKKVMAKYANPVVLILDEWLLSIPIKTSTFFGNSEHSFPEKQSIPFRNRVQFIF